jgi:hypothetical protein
MNISTMNPRKSLQRYRYLLYLSFVPLLLHGLQYAWIGSPYILIFGALITYTVLYQVKNSKPFASKTIKIWSWLMLCYGVMRILLASVNLFMDAMESAIVYQLTLWYIIKSVLYILLGLFLFFTNRKWEGSRTNID